MAKQYFIQTMGCQMNERDSETLAGLLETAGYLPASGPAEADVILLNTCAVREKPEHKVFSLLGELAQYQRRGALVGVCGCVAQTSAEALRERVPQPDFLLGPRDYADLPGLLERLGGGERAPVAALHRDRPIEEGLPAARQSALCASVNIAYGCDNYCTYCIVPYARGPLQSRAPGQVLDEIRGLLEAGYRQVLLLGQNVNAYGQDLDCGIDFPELLYKVDQLCTAGQRVRFTTSHPKDVPPRLLEALRDLPSLCEWLHLPLQAGDDTVLARMGRGYTAQGYFDIVAQAREMIPGLGLSTDVMVAFPGETEAQFENTYRLMERLQFDQAFTFKFSPRAGTAAATMPQQVTRAAAQNRLERLAALVAETAREVNRRQVGQVQEVLVEERDPRSPDCLRGRSRANKLVIFPAAPELIGQTVSVRAEEAFLWGFRGVRAGEPAP